MRKDYQRLNKNCISCIQRYREKVLQEGMRENLGHNYVLTLKSRYVDISEYNDKYNNNTRLQIEMFDDWCESLTYRDFK